MTGALVGCLVAAAVLLATGRRHDRLPHRWSAGPRQQWGVRRFRSRSPTEIEPEPAHVLDLCAAALSAGAPPALALQVAGEAAGGSLGRHCDLVAAALLLGADHESAWAGAPCELEPVRDGLRLVVDAGVPGADLLRGAASAERARRRLRAEARAQALGVRMVLPLGLCALPAFAAWGVVPVVLALAGQLL